MKSDPTFLTDLEAVRWKREPWWERIFCLQPRTPIQHLLRDIYNNKNRQKALSTLYCHLADQGLRKIHDYEKPAIPFLGRLLTYWAQEAKVAELFLFFFVVLAVSEDDCCLGRDGIRWESIWDEECYRLVEAEAPRFLLFLHHHEKSVRLAAIRALAWFPSLADRSVPLLKERVQQGSEDEQVAALVALGLLGHPLAPICDQSARLRFASTVAHCHVHSVSPEHLQVFLEMAACTVSTGVPEELRNEPYDFGLSAFASEVLHRQPPEILEEFLERAPDCSLKRHALLRQPWQ